MCMIMDCCSRSICGVNVYMALFSKIQKFLSHVTYLAQGFRLGGCKPISLFHFIGDKTDAR